MDVWVDVGLLGGRLNEQPAKIYMREEQEGAKLRGKRKTLENGTDIWKCTGMRCCFCQKRVRILAAVDYRVDEKPNRTLFGYKTVMICKDCARIVADVASPRKGDS